MPNEVREWRTVAPNHYAVFYSLRGLYCEFLVKSDPKLSCELTIEKRASPTKRRILVYSVPNWPLAYYALRGPKKLGVRFVHFLTFGEARSPSLFPYTEASG